MPVPAPRRVARGGLGSKDEKKKTTPKRTTSHKFRAQDFVRKRQDETVTDHYTLGKLLGEGQFGEVFVGTVINSSGGKGDSRAIKRIQKELLSEEDHDEVFNEFITLRQMDHPNICKMYEFFEDKESFWFVQELCGGGELLDELERIDNFTEAAAGLIMKQVLSSVHYCHSQKHVVHRDLKLENILLEEGSTTKNGGDQYNPMIVKVIDFGLATTFAEDQVLTSPVGSMHYIAPEVLEQEYKGGTCDIWSCGVIAYILLCGYAPFEAPNDRDMRELIMMGHVSFNDPIWQNDVSQEARDFVSYLLTYEPDKRPDAAQALQHPWIQNATKAHAQQFKATKSGTDSAVKFLSNCRSFEAASKLKQATCAFMTSQLVLSGGDRGEDATSAPDSTATMLGEIFRAIDLDSDGRLSQEELRIGFQDFMGEQSLTVEEVDDVFARMDLSFTGFIDYSEFVVACMGLHDQEQAHHQQLLKQAFERLSDKDGSGFISHEKLKAEMTPFYGDDVEESIIQKIIDQADADKDGQISWDDFQAMMCKTADFVPPDNAMPLSAYRIGAVEGSKASQETEATAKTSPQPLESDAPAAAPEGDANAEPEIKEAFEQAGASATEPTLPLEDTSKTPPTPGRKARSSVGPKARLISAMFEKNLQKNREMGFDQFTYTRKQTQAQKRKLPRTRRVNFEELTKKANTQVDFDARTKMEGRNREIEQLKANTGRARERRATIVSMFHQEKQHNKRETRLQELESIKTRTNAKGRRESLRHSWNSTTKKLEQQKREQRSEELERIKLSMTDDSAAKTRLFESWNQANIRASLADKRTSRRLTLKELKEFQERFKQPVSVMDSSHKHASRRASMPTSRLLRRSSRSWTKRLSGKCLTRDFILRNDGSGGDRRGLDRSSSHSALQDMEVLEERLVEMQPKAKTKDSARRIEPIRRLNSFDSDQEQGDRDERLDEMAPCEILPKDNKPVPQIQSFPSLQSHPPRVRQSSDENPTQKDHRLHEMQHEVASDGAKKPSMFKSSSLHFDQKSLTRPIARGDKEAANKTHQAEPAPVSQREARLAELEQIKQKKSNGTKSTREQFEEKIQANKLHETLGLSKSRSMSVIVGGENDYSKGELNGETNPISINTTDKASGISSDSHYDEKEDDPLATHEEGGVLQDMLQEGVVHQAKVTPDGDMNENSIVGLSQVGNGSFGGSMDLIGMGSYNNLTVVRSADERDLSHPELVSPRPDYEKPAPRDPNKTIKTPKNLPRGATPTTPGSKFRNRMSIQPRGSGPRLLPLLSSQSEMTEAQEKVMQMAKDKAMRSKLVQRANESDTKAN